MHNGPFSELINFGIPGLIFQVLTIKFGTSVFLIMLLNISSGFHGIVAWLYNVESIIAVISSGNNGLLPNRHQWLIA